MANSNDEEQKVDKSEIKPGTKNSDREAELDNIKFEAEKKAKYFATFITTLIDTRFGKITLAAVVVFTIYMGMPPEEREATVKKYQDRIISSAAGILLATFIGSSNKET